MQEKKMETIEGQMREDMVMAEDGEDEEDIRGR